MKMTIGSNGQAVRKGVGVNIFQHGGGGGGMRQL
jgi:hypothetical protein